MDATERRVLDETVAYLELPPGQEADEIAVKSFAFQARLLRERVDELGRALADVGSRVRARVRVR